MYKIGVIGDKDSVLGFKAVGMDVFPAEDGGEISQIISKLAEGGYAVIFITERAAMLALDEIEKYRSRLLPAIIPIPGNRENLGIGMEGIKKSVIKALGADIIFGG